MKRSKRKAGFSVRAGRRSPRRGVTIQWKLSALLLQFTLIILLVVWLFQILLLDIFYENSKQKEMQVTGDAICTTLATPELPGIVERYAEEYQICISIYRIDPETNGAFPEIETDVYNGCIIHHIGNDILQELYRKALDGDGYFVENVTLSSLLEEEILPTPDNIFQRILAGQRADLHKISVRLVIASDNQPYIVMLDSEMTPVNATTRTLKTQFIWIACITVAVALVMAFALSRSISRPVRQMNESAKELGRGRYDVVFRGRGCRELRELGDTLNYAAGELSRADHLQKELIANVSHDLRTPLTMIKGYSEVMQDIPGEITPENLQVITDEATRLSDLVSDLLDLSRLQAGARDPRIEPQDLSLILQNTCTRYEVLLKHKEYRFELSQEDGVFVMADRTMLLQVLNNLMNNAVNYTGEDHRVILAAKRRDGIVRISVTDTGEGIPEEQLPLIWDRYYKVDRVHRRAMIGTGLGLSIVKQLLDSHGAAYGVESTLGEGSTFWFELPEANVADESGEDSERVDIPDEN